MKNNEKELFERISVYPEDKNGKRRVDISLQTTVTEEEAKLKYDENVVKMIEDGIIDPSTLKEEN